MRRVLVINFEKFHGNGNDFIFLNESILQEFSDKKPFEAFVKALCHRNFGVGADGVVFYDEEGALLIVNCDGSLASTCGNALRCYGLLLKDRGCWDGKTSKGVFYLIPNIKGLEVNFSKESSFARLISCSSEQEIEVDMGCEKFVETLDIDPRNNFIGESLRGVFVQLANPHLVFLSSSFNHFTKSQFEGFGLWAQGEFQKEGLSGCYPLSNISMLSLGELSGETTSPVPSYSLVVYERGVGLTLCCGSGAVASRIALEKCKLVREQDDRVRFLLPGGVVSISRSFEHSRSLFGSAQFVYKGTFSWI